MNDRELLELAAMAAGHNLITHTGYDEEGGVYVTHTWVREQGCLVEWNPLYDDGDALRLAVKLDIDYYHYMKLNSDILGSYENDPYAATRRAIVRAAVEIGKEMN